MMRALEFAGPRARRKAPVLRSKRGDLFLDPSRSLYVGLTRGWPGGATLPGGGGGPVGGGGYGLGPYGLTPYGS